jgi:TRAP-type C4-dicarboxylate transport system permease large subunit
MIPEMEKKGYPREYAAAVTASGSVQAILIPPSHNSVIYSLAAGARYPLRRCLLRAFCRVCCWA